MKNTKPNLYVVSQSEYLWPFAGQFNEVSDWRLADAMMFTGGHDVSPDLYGERVGQHTYTNPGRNRDEQKFFEFAQDKGIPCIGICRGAQFLTVMSGGALVQDVTGHGLRGYHHVITPTGDTVVMSSTHHQMMRPEILDKEDYVLLGWADHLSRHYLDGDNKSIPHSGIEPEMVWYKKTRCLCIQGHPEIMHPDDSGVKYCQELVERFILSSLV